MKFCSKAITMALLACTSIIGCNPTVAIPPVSPLSSATPYILDTPLPTIQPTPTFSPTETLVPALPADEAEVRAIVLLSNNGGCRLPCIWGFTPGKTNARMVWSLLHAFDPLLDGVLFDEIGGGAGIYIQRDDLTIETHFTVEGDRVTQSGILRRIVMRMGIYRKVAIECRYRLDSVYDSPYFAQLFQYYTLPYLLTNYGPPDNVSVAVYFAQDVGGGDDVYFITLDYKESGWIAFFGMPIAQDGDRWLGCPTHADAYLRTWAPGDTRTANEEGFTDTADWIDYFSIEEATSLTLDEFYQQFKDPDNTQCLESPMELWMP